MADLVELTSRATDASGSGMDPQALGIGPQRPDGATEAVKATPTALAVAVLGIPGDLMHLDLVLVQAAGPPMSRSPIKTGTPLGRKPDRNPLR
jgi:hypothetical protein